MNGTKNTRKSVISKETKTKKDAEGCSVTLCGCRGACISRNDWTKGRDFNEEIIKAKTKQNKTNVTPKKDNITSVNQTPRG